MGAEVASAVAKVQQERSHSGGSPFRALVGVSHGSDLATPCRKFSIDDNQPTLSAGNFHDSLDGIEQADPGNLLTHPNGNAPTMPNGNLFTSQDGVQMATSIGNFDNSLDGKQPEISLGYFHTSLNGSE
jgi:hypothetical protein